LILEEYILSHTSDLPWQPIKILSIDDVVKLFRQFKDRKELFKEHSHFLCDNRIMSHLYNALGTTFGSKNHYPVPVTVNEDFSNFSKVIGNSILSSTYVTMKGISLGFRIGYTCMTVNEVIENIDYGLKWMTGSIDKNVCKLSVSDIHSIHIKTAQSPSLPIYGKPAIEAIEFLKKQISTTEEKPSIISKTPSAEVRVIEKVFVKSSKNATSSIVDTSDSKKAKEALKTKKPDTSKSVKRAASDDIPSKKIKKSKVST
jgi:hypothetical protein